MSLSWNTPPDLFANVVTDDLDRMYRGFCLTVFNAIILLSPVASGAYRGNHRITINSKDYGYDKNDTTNKVGQMQAVLNSIQRGRFPEVTIQNNLPYALRLENGYSRQSPNGIYSLAFTSAVASYS